MAALKQVQEEMPLCIWRLFGLGWCVWPAWLYDNPGMFFRLRRRWQRWSRFRRKCLCVSGGYLGWDDAFGQRDSMITLVLTYMFFRLRRRWQRWSRFRRKCLCVSGGHLGWDDAFGQRDSMITLVCFLDSEDDGSAEAGSGGNASVYLEVIWAGMMRLASVTLW